VELEHMGARGLLHELIPFHDCGLTDLVTHNNKCSLVGKVEYIKKFQRDVLPETLEI
jgi:hypothetical protein